MIAPGEGELIVNLEGFEGPLDLLLTLARDQKVDLLRISMVALVDQYLAPAGDTYWVQRQNAPTPASGTAVTTNDTAPTADRYDLAVVEVLAAP